MGRGGSMSITTPPSIKSNPNSRYLWFGEKVNQTNRTKNNNTIPLRLTLPKFFHQQNIFLTISFLKFFFITTKKKFQTKNFHTDIFFCINIFFDLQFCYFQTRSKLKSFQAEHFRPQSCYFMLWNQCSGSRRNNSIICLDNSISCL